MRNDKPHVRVVAAELERDGRYLITQRREHAVLPLLWEFPGGKVEDGEDDSAALRRELRERLGVGAEVGALHSRSLQWAARFSILFLRLIHGGIFLRNMMRL